MLSISIVIPTMNRIDSLKRTISLIADGNLLPNEIIIVDQTQDEKAIKATEAFCNSQNIQCIYLHQSQPSLTKARNLGMKYVTGDLVIQMDDDVDIYPNTLSTIIDIFSDAKIAMLAGVDENTNNQVQSNLGYFFLKKNWFKRKIGHVTLSMYGRFPINIGTFTSTEWAMGFFSVYRKKLIDKWKLKWDENLTGYAYAEDLDFSYSYFLHARQEKFRCILSNRIIVKHNVTNEWRIPSKKHSYMIIQHREYLRNKFHHTSIASKLAIHLSDWGEYLRRILKNEAAEDWKEGLKIKKKNLKKIRQGNFFY